MAADGVQRLELKDLDAVLERAKAEEWTELALVGSYSIAQAEVEAAHLTESSWPTNRVYLVLHESALQNRPTLNFASQLIGDFRLMALAELDALRSLLLRHMEIGDSGAKLLSRLSPDYAPRLAGVA